MSKVRLDHYIDHVKDDPRYHHHHTDHNIVISHAHDELDSFQRHDHLDDPPCIQPDIHTARARGSDK